jgi:predicted Zn-dependent peptidase
MTARLHRLSNGVRVLCDPMPELETFALSVVVRGGSRWEPEDRAGWSHLLEHMVFKGAGGRTAREIVEHLEADGAQINAATGYEQTSFQVRALKGGLPLAMEIVSDLVLRPTIDADELEREKGVVAQEIAEAYDAPDDWVFDLAQEQAYRGQALGRPILGTVKSVNAADRSGLEAWRKALYAPERLAVSVAGAVDEDELLALADRFFGAEKPDGLPPDPEPARFTGGAIARARRIEQANLVWQLPAPGVKDQLYYAARLFAEVLGGGMASRLFQEAREKQGLAYTIDAWAEAYEETGVLGIYAGCAAGKAEGLARLAAAQIRSLAEGATDAELARGKAQLKAALFMAQESPLARAERAAGQAFLFGRVLGADEVRAGVDGVGEDDLRRVGELALSPGLAAAAVLGPKTALRAAPAFGRALFG